MDVKKIYYADRMLYADNILNKERVSHLIKIACALCNDVLFLKKLIWLIPWIKRLYILPRRMELT